MPYWAAQAKGAHRGGGCCTRASNGPGAPNPTVETLGNANDHGPPPYFFLEDINWVEQVHVHCIGGSSVEMESVDDAIKTRAELLAKLI
jgi:hypothetical protein